MFSWSMFSWCSHLILGPVWGGPIESKINFSCFSRIKDRLIATDAGEFLEIGYQRVEELSGITG